MGVCPADEQVAADSDMRTRTDPSAAVFRTVLYYLEHMRLPQWSSARGGDALLDSRFCMCSQRVKDKDSVSHMPSIVWYTCLVCSLTGSEYMVCGRLP